MWVLLNINTRLWYKDLLRKWHVGCLWDQQTVTTATVTTSCLKICTNINRLLLDFTKRHAVAVVAVTACWSCECWTFFFEQGVGPGTRRALGARDLSVDRQSCVIRGNISHNRNRDLRSHRGFSVAFPNGFSVSFCNVLFLFGEFWCVIFCPESRGRLQTKALPIIS